MDRSVKLPYWAPYSALAVVAAAVLAVFIWLVPTKPIFLERVREAEKERVIKTYAIPTPRGEILVTELRSGTEFNRILQMPGGATIAEGGWVNRWGEEQIRMIGPSKDESDR
jgi:hypothetical protein